MRRTRKSLRRRAEQHTDSYATPVHRFKAEPARFRVMYAWLQGYDAARRDMRKSK